MQRAWFALLFVLMLDGPAARFLTGSTAVARILTLFFGVGLALDLGACSESATADTGGTGGTTSAGTGGTAGGAGLTFSLSLGLVSPDYLTPLDPMSLTPSEVANVVVTAYPPGAHDVRFALLGTPLDAVLSATTVSTDESSGTNTVMLTAPSTPSSFSVRALASGATAATLDLAVEETNMASLSIKPSYAGERALRGYVASATPNTPCTDLMGSPPPDGSISAPASDIWPIALDVPTGQKLAVVLRAEEFAWGCTTLNNALEGVTNQVEVVMANVPMKLDSSNVRFTLDLDSSDAFDTAFASSEATVTASLLGDATDDVEALLDAMGDLASDPNAYASARTAGDWDTAVRTALGGGGGEALRAPLTRWIDAGLPASGDTDGIVGTLTGSGDGAAPKVALESAFGLDAASAGFTQTGTASWNASADDSVVIGFSMSVAPATFLLAGATAPALAAVTGATDLASALAGAVPCSLVADTLAALGSKSSRALPDCGKDSACAQQMCENAVSALVTQALASDTAPASLDVALTASGSVGDSAELTSFTGQWLGRLTTDDGPSSLTGVATGAQAK